MFKKGDKVEFDFEAEENKRSLEYVNSAFGVLVEKCGPPPWIVYSQRQGCTEGLVRLQDKDGVAFGHFFISRFKKVDKQ